MMSTPQPLEPKSAAPRRIGLHRFSVAEFLIALVLLFVVSPFVELIPGGNLIEAVLITLVLVMGVLAVGRRRRTLVVAAILALPAFIWQMGQSLLFGLGANGGLSRHRAVVCHLCRGAQFPDASSCARPC